MARYAVYLHFDLLEDVPARGDQRRRIMDFVRSLADQPNTPGDHTDTDGSVRTRQIKIVGQYAVTYWLDEPVRIVMVVGVRRAAR